ncbi:formylglycine-generating enzyme family protein [Thiothrix subterranea]|nr:formylglycine-generating enzyme family protein [Thiothrix subterranea]
MVTLDTGLERLVITPLTKPGWASEIIRTPTGLEAVMPFAGKHYRFFWAEGEYSRSGNGFAGHWVCNTNEGVGFDDYGLYADLDIKETGRSFGKEGFIEVIIPQRFRWIESGTFLMGSSESEAERYDDEVQHQVTLTQGFWLADSTITQYQWKSVMGDNPSNFRDNLKNPVEKVSWNDIQYYLQKLNAFISGVQAKLPTEAQWEYACRAGTTTPFSFGDNITPEQVNYDGNHPYANGKKGLYREEIVPVKSLSANPWGLYEMHGNVWEWCHDVWQEKLPALPVTDPDGVAGDVKQAGLGYAVRGGSWRDDGGSVRSAFRLRRDPTYRNNDLGFRLALSMS